MRVLTQLSARLQEPFDAGFVPMCKKIREVVAELERMAKDLPSAGTYAEPWGAQRPAMLAQAKEALEAVEVANKKLTEIRRRAIEHGCTS